MADYPYGEFTIVSATNPDNLAAQNDLVTIHAPGDPARTPIELRDLGTGQLITNPIGSNVLARCPGFIADIPEVVAYAAAPGIEVKLESTAGIRDDARAAATDAATSKTAAETAAGNAAAAAQAELEARIAAGEFKGEQGLPGPNAIPADEAVAGYISAVGTTATKTAMDKANSTFVGSQLGAEVIGGALTFTALQTAADAAATNGRTLYAAGTLTTDQTLVIRSDTDLGALTINYTGAGVAVRVGETASSLFRKQGTLPRVTEALNTTAGSWVDAKVGIQFVNNDSCVWLVPHVKNFGVGVDEVGDGRGHAYNTFTFGHLENNKVNHRFRSLGVGWANQNTHIGGRFGQNSGEGTGTVGARHVEIQTADANAINNNTWIGSSFEGNVPEYHANIAGTANMFLNCRWESSAGPKVRWQANAVNNQILYGYGSGQITQTHGTAATRNHVVTPTKMELLTSFGVLYESTAGNTGVADAVMGSGGIVAGTNPATGYAVKRTANATHMKRPTDAYDRVRLDHVNGRVYLGNGTAEPTMYVGVAGSALRIETTTSTTAPAAGAAAALPATPAGYMDVYVAGAVRKMPYY